MPIIGAHAKRTTIENVATVIYELLQHEDINAEAVFERAHLIVPRLSDPENRLTFSELERLLIECVKTSQNPIFGMGFGRWIHPTTFHALGLALLSSDNIRAFFERLARYYKFITSNERVELEVHESGLAVKFLPRPEVKSSSVYHHLVLGSFSTYIEWLRSMYRHDYVPEAIEFSFQEPEGANLCNEYFGVKCKFGGHMDVLYISEDQLDVPLPAANAELARMHDEVVVKFLARSDQKDLVNRVHAQIIQRLPSGDCNKSQVANALYMSTRTLHNRLANEGTSYHDILMQTRRELSEQYMAQQNLSVSEIAYTLGFSDCSNFSRAFHRWTGQSPTAFRESLRTTEVST